jgi:hypothetical protein
MRDASFHGRIKGLPAAASVPAQFWQAPMPPVFKVGTSSAPALKVYLNHGRWVVNCPDCNGAQLACFDDKRFMCNECANVAVGNLWRVIVWPEDRRAVEEAVAARPVLNQNWVAGESIADLLRQNLIGA